MNELRYACLSQILILTAVIWLRNRKDVRVIYITGFAAGVSAFLFLTGADRTSWPVFLLPTLAFVQTAGIFFFWILSLSIFQDGFKPGWKHWAVLTAKLTVFFLSYMPDRPFVLNAGTFEEKRTLQMLPPSLFSAALVLHAMYLAFRDLSDDLVESRKRIRIVHLSASGSAILVLIFFRLAFHGVNLDRVFETAALLLTLVTTVWLSLSLFRIREGFFDETEKKQIPLPADPALNEKIAHLFNVEKVYRMEGLTIRKLALMLGEPEYRLRRHINGSLRFRNFNDFLNRHRIQDACETLLNEKQKDIPVIRIAMDLGYRSLGSFNKAFKELTGMTPSAYRKSGGRDTAEKAG